VASLLDRLFGRGGRTDDDRPVDYDEAKALARHRDIEVRRRLAARADLVPEILYYLAEDPSPEVRREIARNATAPQQADLLLAHDADEGVRGELAAKIARLAPGLSADEHDRLRRMTYEALEILARDQIVVVRRIIAETLKDVANAPPEVIRRLARDSELVVSAPVLQFSPVLTDEDLIEIIRLNPVQGAIGAISRRSRVAAAVADAVVASDDVEAIADLLGNASAQIREETLDRIIDRAPDVEAWHAPLVRRPALPAKAARKLARFVADSLLKVLEERQDLDPETVAAVRTEVQRRIDAGPARPEAAGEETRTPREIAEAMHREGRLDEKAIATALVQDGDREFVQAALAVLGGLPPDLVKKIVNTKSAKGITAVAWKAGLSMRFAVQLQLGLSRISYGDLLNPRNGTEYPLSEDEMWWQLELFGDLRR
jgi:uncharacterized protein (DUF2336 family)